MDFKRETVSHHEDIYVGYDTIKYKEVTKNRWDPYKNEPLQKCSRTLLCMAEACKYG